MKILQICPTHLSNVATLPWEIQKSHFNGIIHTYFRLFTFSQKKTNCNPLAHPTWKCHHTNLWTAKLFHLTEGLMRSFKRWSAEEKQLWVFIGGSEKNRLWCLATGKQCVQSDYLLHGYMLPVFFDTDLSHSTPHCAEIQPTSQQATAATCPYQYTRSYCSMPQMQK